jgi:Fur family ferric uptake transcriptional regulator
VTVASHAEPLSFDTVQEAVAELRRRGMRLSTARRLVLEALYGADGPVSALRLSELLAIDPASVYRNLEALERHGLVRHVHLAHGPGLFVLCSREEREYLYCESCARVTPVAPRALDPLRRRVRERFGYEVRFTHFALVGVCASCAALQRPDASGAVAGRGRTGHRHGQSGAPAAGSAAGGGDHMHSHGSYVHSHAGQTRTGRRRGAAR